MQKLIIGGRLPGLNEYTKACRSGAYAGAGMKKETEDMITWYIVQQLKDVRFDAPVEVAFRWYEQNRKRDIDNIAFAKKFILDALVKSGIIRSDGWSGVAKFTDEFFIDPKNPRIEVDIEFCDRTLPF